MGVFFLKYTVRGTDAITFRRNTLQVTASTPSEAESKASGQGLLPPYEVYDENYFLCDTRKPKTNIRIMEEIAAAKIAKSEAENNKEIPTIKTEKANHLGCLIAIGVVVALIITVSIFDAVFKDEIQAEEKPKAVEIFTPDALQWLFLSATEYLTREELEELVRERGLYFDTETYGGSWEEILSYKIGFSHEEALHRYGAWGDYVEFIFNNFSHKKLIEVNYYNANHGATAEFNPPRNYHYAYYDLKEGTVRYSCKDSWDALYRVLAHER